MRYILTGQGGYFATELSKFLVQQGEHVVFTSSELGESKALHLQLLQPELFDYGQITDDDLVIHLASISSPDFCQTNKEEAFAVNGKGTIQFVRGCLEKGAKVVFFSSDTVYGQSSNGSSAFDELSPCNPWGEYARLKLLVENALDGFANLKTFRISYMFGKNDKFTRYLAKCSQENQVADVFHPIYRNVVYVKDVMDGVYELSKRWAEFSNGVFNICGTETLSRLQMAEAYVRLVDRKLRTRIVEPSNEFFVARPKTIAVRSLYFSNLLKRTPIQFEEALTVEFQNQ